MKVDRCVMGGIGGAIGLVLLIVGIMAGLSRLLVAFPQIDTAVRYGLGVMGVIAALYLGFQLAYGACRGRPW